MAERKQREASGVALFFWPVEVESLDSGFGNPSIIIMTDHNGFWGSGGATGVDERTAVSGFLFIHTILNGFCFTFGTELCLAYLEKFIPGQHLASYLFGEVVWNRIFPNNEILDFWCFWKYFDVLAKLLAILQNDDFALWMVCDVLTRFGGVCRVYTDWKIVAENWSRKSDCPLWRIETDDVYCCIVSYTQSDQGLCEIGWHIEILLVGVCDPLVGFFLEIESCLVLEFCYSLQPHIGEGHRGFWASSGLLDSNGQFNLVIWGPEEVSFWYGLVKVL